MHPVRLIAVFLTLCTLGGMVGVTPALADTPVITASGVLAFTNAERIREKTPTLSIDTQLSAVASRKMQDLFARQYFAHESPTGEDVGDLVKEIGYDYITVGENLALGDFASSKDVVQAWMDSPGHRANILARKYSEIGIAAGRGPYKGRSTWIVVQTFGLPRSACPVIDPVVKAKVTSLTKTLELLERVATRRESLAKDTSASRDTYIERVASYNTAAKLYNARAKEYRALVEKYNKSVDRSNSCVKEISA